MYYAIDGDVKYSATIVSDTYTFYGIYYKISTLDNTNCAITFTNVLFYPTSRLGPTGPYGLARLSYGPTGPNVTKFNLTTAAYTKYFLITNTGFNGITLPTASLAESDLGGYWVLVNTTTSYLTITVTNPTASITTPLIMAPNTGITIAVYLSSLPSTYSYIAF
jgi:hypothetical protein